ncbi:MAG: 2-phosphosulfolactate phosphatase [Candidatus Thermoplasmatota archaeon]|nr:2-phosphosulfolactate phosphatase [Candidatus Thermoplasmatota archaeon]MCL5988417.1 2-phosphosulfolactate phosphatase [Candidatus Thermoplasmatota archaeon]
MKVTIIEGRKIDDYDKSAKILVDVYRSTSTMPIMLKNGAQRIIPFSTLKKARELKKRNPEYIIAGERYGFKIPGFDMSNSPHESAHIDLSGKTIIFSSTNGTKALEKIKESKVIYVASFVNFSSTCSDIIDSGIDKIDVILSGRPDGSADEDLYFGLAVKEMLEDGVDRTDHYITKTRQGSGTKRLTMIGGGRDVTYSLKKDFANFPVIYRDGNIIRKYPEQT